MLSQGRQFGAFLDVPQNDGGVPRAAKQEVRDFGVPKEASHIFCVSFEDLLVIGHV